MFVHAESLSYLQEGLTLDYQETYALKYPNWHSGQFGVSRDLTIRVLHVDQVSGRTTIEKDDSYVATFPPGTHSSRLEGINFDGSKPIYKTSGDTGKRSWSVKSTIVLSGRTVASIEGDRVDFLWLRAQGDYGMWTSTEPWTDFYDWWNTDSPLGYPTYFFLYPGTSPGDDVPSYKVAWKNDSPLIEDTSFPIVGTAVYSAPFGDRETLVAEGKYEGGGGWQIEWRDLWDAETGILLKAEQTGTNPQGPGGSFTEELRLVDASPWPKVTTTTAETAVVTATATATIATTTGLSWSQDYLYVLVVVLAIIVGALVVALFRRRRVTPISPRRGNAKKRRSG